MDNTQFWWLSIGIGAVVIVVVAVLQGPQIAVSARTLVTPRARAKSSQNSPFSPHKAYTIRDGLANT